jgi:FLVCR family feline leukemia virus subgroup C receptor-related protein
VVGIIVSFISGYLLNKYHRYMLMLRVSAFGTFILSSAAIGTFLTKDVLLVATNMIVVAAFLIPVIPLSIDFAGELTFPLEETVTTGFLLMSAQALGFVLSLIVLQLALIHAIYGLSLIVACAGIAAVISATIKDDLRRVSFTVTQEAAIKFRRESLIRIKTELETEAQSNLIQ